MIEDFTRTAITTLLMQGTGWVVAVLLGIWAWIMDKRLAALHVTCDVQARAAEVAVREQYEKRLDEFKIVLDVMTTQTNTVKALHQSQLSATESINQLAAAFTTMLRETETSRSKWEDRGGNLARSLEDIRSRIEQLQRRAG